MIRMPRKIKIPLTLLGISLCCSAILYAIAAEPAYGDPNAPAHREVSPAGTVTPGTYYTRNAYADAHTPNMVTVTLADYRGFDTFGETTVVFAGCVCVMLLLRRRRRRKGDRV
ncbi:MAG: hydrogen gas-evolving membrane-bound hydrogenase subunit E [Planctomycetota bacterium]|jgi:multicomponent Na+:H+ antiporter subunit B